MRRCLAALAMLVVGVTGCGRVQNSLLLLERLPDVASITIEGNKRFGDGTLKKLMVLRGPSRLNPFREHKYRPALLESDIRAILTYYMRHGYLRARLDSRQVRREGNQVHIVLKLDEGEPVSVAEVTIRGARALNPNRLRNRLAIKPDEPLDPFRLEDDRRLLLQTLADRGYWEAAVRTNVQFFGNRALVFYILREGEPVTVRRVEVEGTHWVRPELARREISVREGRRLRLTDLTRSQVRLIQSGYFADAQWDTTGVDTLTDEVTIRFRVRERRLHWMEGGVGVTSEDQVRLTGQWGTRNFLGTGMRFAVNSRTELDFTDLLPTILNDHRTEVILNQPHLLGTRWEGQPSGFYLRDNEYIKDLKAAYAKDVWGVGASVRRRLGNLRNQVVVSLENRWVRNDADSAARVNDPQLFRKKYQTRLLSVRLERDIRNDFFNPSRGGYQNMVLESAGGALGGNNAFRKGTVGLAQFYPLPMAGGVMAVRVQVGLVKPSAKASTVAGRPITSRVELVPSEDRYRLGGANSVRGFRQDELDGTTGEDQPVGGLTEFLGNLELREPLFGRFSLVSFLDAGNVWGDHHRITWARFVPHRNRQKVSPFDVRYTYGLGLRFNTPLGPIRVDYARKWNLPHDNSEGKDRWHVALGQAF